MPRKIVRNEETGRLRYQRSSKAPKYANKIEPMDGGDGIPIGPIRAARISAAPDGSAADAILIGDLGCVRVILPGAAASDGRASLRRIARELRIARIQIPIRRRETIREAADDGRIVWTWPADALTQLRAAVPIAIIDWSALPPRSDAADDDGIPF